MGFKLLEKPEDIVVGVTHVCNWFKDDVRVGMCSLISSRRGFLVATLPIVRDRGKDLSIDEELEGRES